jgi:putative membrane protein
MNLSALLAFIHHLTAFTLVAAITVEWVLWERHLTLSQAKRIQRADLAYGMSAGVLLVAGLLRVLYFEKGSAYYFGNAFFFAKVSLFLLVALVSIYPTVLFLSWSRPLKAGDPPRLTDIQFRRVRTLLVLELVGIIGTVLCAPAMARGAA